MDWQFYVTLLNEGLRELPDDVAMEKLKDLHGFQRRTFSVGGIKCSPRRLACFSYLHTLCGRGVRGTKKQVLMWNCRSEWPDSGKKNTTLVASGHMTNPIQKLGCENSVGMFAHVWTLVWLVRCCSYLCRFSMAVRRCECQGSTRTNLCQLNPKSWSFRAFHHANDLSAKWIGISLWLVPSALCQECLAGNCHDQKVGKSSLNGQSSMVGGSLSMFSWNIIGDSCEYYL